METKLGTPTARQQAEEEIRREDFRDEVRAVKEKIRQRRDKTIWRKIFPWKLTIERR